MKSGPEPSIGTASFAMKLLSGQLDQRLLGAGAVVLDDFRRGEAREPPAFRERQMAAEAIERAGRIKIARAGRIDQFVNRRSRNGDALAAAGDERSLGAQRDRGNVDLAG